MFWDISKKTPTMSQMPPFGRLALRLPPICPTNPDVRFAENPRWLLVQLHFNSRTLPLTPSPLVADSSPNFCLPNIFSLFHCFTVSLFHCFTVSLFHFRFARICFVMSIRHCPNSIRHYYPRIEHTIDS